MNGNGGTEQLRREANQRMLAGLLAQRNLGFFRRLTARVVRRLEQWSTYWATLSRQGRRAIGRRLAPVLLGSSLLAVLVLSAVPVRAATIDVDAVAAIADDGFCSLGEAILNANNDSQNFTSPGECIPGSGHDVINLTADVTLSVPNVYGFGAQIGLPTIASTMTIEGNGHVIRRDDSAPDFRILANIAYNPGLTLNNVTISGGSAPTAEGGGIHNRGWLTLNNSSVSGNQARNGGGIFHFYGSLVLNDSAVNDNIAGYPGYRIGTGGGIYSENASLALDSSTVNGNDAGMFGGGIYVTGTVYVDSTLSMTDSSVSGNYAVEGGGISSRLGLLTLISSSINSNTAPGEGGGIASYDGSLTLTNSTVSGNSTGNGGGGIDNEYNTVTLNGSTISDNTAYYGGGLANTNASVTLTNSTISSNEAYFYGAGIHNTSSSLEMTNSTISDNSTTYAVSSGGGLFNAYHSTTILARSIISGNSAVGAGDEVFNDSLSTMTAGDHNLFGHSGLANVAAFAGFTPSGSDTTATSNGTNPAPLDDILAPLADNDGLTLTHALPLGSPAIDVAPSADCTVPPSDVDQRGLPRGVDGNSSPSSNECDAGAYEAQPPLSPLIYVSPLVAGNVDGLNVRRQDIVVYDQSTGNWAVHFDGSDVGVTQYLAAFAHLPDGDLLLAFKTNQHTPAGTFTPWDIARFTPSSFGSTTTGTFSWYIDGFDVGLTKPSEKIDALDVLSDGRVLISTTGALSVVASGKTLNAKDEDLTALTPTALGTTTDGTWALYFNGSKVPGLGIEDVVGAHVDEATDNLYIAISGKFNIGGVNGNGKDIVKLHPSGDSYTVTRYWRGGDHGFDLSVSGLEFD